MRRLTRRRAAGVSAVALALLWALGAVPPLAASGESVSLDSFTLQPGATVVLEFEVTVDDPIVGCALSVANQGTFTGANFAGVPTDDPDTVAAADSTITPLDVIDLAITKTDGATTEIPGTPVTYTITASNAGPGAAVAATVADTFPAVITGVTWTCVGAGGGTCTAAGAGPISDSVNLPAGGSVTYTATGTISAAATGSLSNTATVTKAAGQIECNLANNSVTDTDTLTPQADLAITKTDGLTDVNAGSPTSYTIVVTNAGPSDAVGATVADTFPAALLSPTWSCVASPGSSCNAGPVPGSINDLVTLRSGGTLTYTANATVSGAASGTLANTATVAAPGGTTDPVPANNSATDTTNVLPVADLSITKTDGTSTAVAGLQTTYTIVAANAGPATATGAAVADTFPATLACTWTCVGAGGGTCTAGPIAGNIADGANLPAGATATYTAVCTIAPTATGTIANTATISGGGVSDTTPGNNSATDTDTLLPFDYGDAPNATLGPPWSYPTLLADGGARHAVNGPSALRMGAVIDTESDGQPTLGADGDDLNGLVGAPPIEGSAPDDEDGVALPAALVACESANVSVIASAAGLLDAFVDFNADGDFADPGEQIFTSQALVAGANPLAFAVPCGATPTALTFARFRLSTAGGLGPFGTAADGEVEDYTVAVRGLDFGDAPAPYPTLFAANGARHVVTGSGPLLGALVDTESNGQPTAGATGDDLNGSDDEDGVSFTTPLVRGQNAGVTVTATAAGVLNAWIDFNGDGNWTTPGDQIFTNQGLVAGPNNLTFAVPPTATTNLATVARFRVASAGGLAPTGLAPDGEVEDHAVATAAEADVAIAKDDGSATEVPGTTVTYTIVASNTGPDAASGVTVSDTFPAILSGCSTTSVAAGGATGNDGGPFAGNINDSGITLPNGASVTYTTTCTISAAATGALANTATVSSSVGDPVPGNNSSTDVDTLTPQTDLAITKSDGATTEIPGTPVTYTIVAANSGPSDATGATVADTFPPSISGVTWSCVGAGGGTCPTNGAGNINAPVNLPVGGTATFTATGTIAASATGSLTNTATIAAGGGATDPNPGNNSATDVDTLTPQTDLAITKTDGNGTEVPGTPVTYTIVASNAGPSDAVGATVADTFPATIGGVTWTCVGAAGGSCPAGGAGNINAPVNLPVGGTATFTATGTIASSATGTLANTATIAAGGGATDPNPGNNSATDVDTLVPSADLAITKDDSADPPPAGENLIYTISVHNVGPSDAASVVVTDPLPAAVTYVSDDCGGSNVPPWTWNVGALVAGATVSCDVTVSINPAPPPSISNTATVTAATADPVPGNNSDTEETTLDATPPKVDNLGSDLDTGDGTLEECETARVFVTHLVATFSEAMKNPPGDSDPHDVTNPANYQLVTPGADLAFDTNLCGVPAGDDVAVAPLGVTYDGGSFTADVAFGSLPDGPYRLLLCPALTDLAGNPLDGDGNDTGGDEFERNFRLDAANRLANGHFDCDLAAWTVSTPTPGETTWTALDAAGAAESGSAETVNFQPGFDTAFALTQCAEGLLPGAQHLSASVRMSAAPNTFVSLTRECEFFSVGGCAGSLGTLGSSQLLGDSAGGWLNVAETLTAPAGSASARCAFRFDTPTGVAFTAHLDRLFLGAAGLIFADGFESGDTAAWSSCGGCAP